MVNAKIARTRFETRWILVFLILLSFWLPSLGTGIAEGCGPGRGGGRRRGPRKLTPLVFKQHVPNVSENTLPASGLSEGRVSRHDARFRDLVPNYNQDIIFKDEEGTGADRLMTQRCKEKLNTLAISVMNQWPGVKLRVTEGWDEEDKHATDSLHYEGRAVDVTTSDRDRSKYGMLARLAVEAGFDWVYYESRSHIHCSVKSESSSAGKSGGCFPGKSIVRTEDGLDKSLDQLRIGERVLALDSTGTMVYSEVIAFLDRSPEERRQFVRLTTQSGRALTLTPSHLVPVSIDSVSTTEFAAKVRVDDRILVNNGNRSEAGLRWDRVVSTSLVLEEGIYAPLTTEGTVLVDDVVASCYAIVDSQVVAHYAFLPMRIWTNLRSGITRIARIFVGPLSAWSELRQGFGKHVVKGAEISRDNGTGHQPQGVHWYATILYNFSFYVLPADMLY